MTLVRVFIGIFLHRFGFEHSIHFIQFIGKLASVASGYFSKMKTFFYFISVFCLVAASSKLSFHIEYDESPMTGLCIALRSVIQQNVLTPPLSIQSRDGSFDHRCIDASTNNVTIVINLTTNISHLVSKSSVIIAETKLDVLMNNMTHLMNHRGNHLIVVRQFKPGELDELAYQCWKNLLVNVSFLTHDDVDSEIVSLRTFIPFNEANCNDTSLRIINIFNGKTQTWHSRNFFPTKLTNLHGCSLRIAMHESAIPFIMRREIVDGEGVLKGRAFQIVTALSRWLNFSIDVIYNTSVNGYETCLERVTNNEAEMFIGNVLIDRTNVDLMDFAFPIFFEHLKFIIPPGRAYTQAENLARVFDSVTWTLILLVLLFFGGTVVFISYQSRKVKMYAFGDKYNNALMDHLATIFGVGVATSPQAHLPRLINMKFVLLCLIIRSIYQGSLYNFLQSGARTKPVQSIDEMIAKEFTFFMVRPYDVYLDQTSKHFAR